MKIKCLHSRANGNADKWVTMEQIARGLDHNDNPIIFYRCSECKREVSLTEDKKK